MELCETLARGEAVAALSVDDRVKRNDVDTRGLDETLELVVDDVEAFGDREVDSERDSVMVAAAEALSEALPVSVGESLEEYDMIAEIDAAPTDCVGELSELRDARYELVAESLGLRDGVASDVCVTLACED